ncbi:MAG: divalent-cation tolerance protein CutA [Ignavibacteria bacterium]|nr:divalent-cation tolerance protein CutA [Ignavibacteria bacterium]
MNNFIEYSLIFITVPSLEEARTIAKTLVEERLVSSVTTIPSVISTFKFQDKIEEYSETQIIVKTRSNLFEKLTDRVKQLHSAILPEIIKVRVSEMPPDLMMWVQDQML